MLERSGRFIYRRRYAVIAVWAVLVIALLPFAPRAREFLKPGGFTNENFQSVEARRVLQDRLDVSVISVELIFVSRELTAYEPDFIDAVETALEPRRSARPRGRRHDAYRRAGTGFRRRPHRSRKRGPGHAPGRVRALPGHGYRRRRPRAAGDDRDGRTGPLQGHQHRQRERPAPGGDHCVSAGDAGVAARLRHSRRRHHARRGWRRRCGDRAGHGVLPVHGHRHVDLCPEHRDPAWNRHRHRLLAVLYQQVPGRVAGRSQRRGRGGGVSDAGRAGDHVFGRYVVHRPCEPDRVRHHDVAFGGNRRPACDRLGVACRHDPVARVVGGARTPRRPVAHRAGLGEGPFDMEAIWRAG